MNQILIRQSLIYTPVCIFKKSENSESFYCNRKLYFLWLVGLAVLIPDRYKQLD